MQLILTMLLVLLSAETYAAVQKDSGSLELTEGGGQRKEDCKDKTAAALIVPKAEPKAAKKAVEGLLQQGKLPAETTTLEEQVPKAPKSPTLGMPAAMGNCT